jgi:hypothetical protein
MKEYQAIPTIHSKNDGDTVEETLCNALTNGMAEEQGYIITLDSLLLIKERPQ